jgi:hypothetical protein
MVAQYGYVEHTTPSPAAAAAPLANAVAAAVAANSSLIPGSAPLATNPAPVPPPTVAYQLTNPPSNDDWKSTTDAVGNLADDIKSNAEMQMLTLQDLVSQRQQVVELATGMMSKEDETLTDGAKAIGQQ